VATHRKIKNTIHLHRYEIEHEIGQTWRLSEEDDARDEISVSISTGIISFRVLGVFATIVFHTCSAAWDAEKKFRTGAIQEYWEVVN
jgi:hypothetical protein